jgi:hypothetical protein
MGCLVPKAKKRDQEQAAILPEGAGILMAYSQVSLEDPGHG